MSSRLLAALVALSCAPAPAFAAQSPSPAQRFAALVDRYYAEFPKFHPTAATELGWHSHDAQLESLKPADQKAEAARLRRWDAEFAAVDGAQLARAEAADLILVRHGIASALVELEEIQGWRHRPDFYPGLASRSIYAIIKRNFAPVDERAASVIAREKRIVGLLAEGEANLQGVAKIAVEISLDELPGIGDFFTHDVPLALPGLSERQRGELAASTALVTHALKRYEKFLREKILPHADAPFAIGEALFRKKLSADEMIDTPLDELLARGAAELARLQAEFKTTAARIDAKKSFADVQADMQKDHPPAERLIADTQARLAGLRRFLVDRQIVSLPSEIMPRVEETPPFMRATTFASMETPGPFETRATEAYYNVTLPESGWTPALVEEFLRGAFNRPLIDVVSIHEAFPGHYVQFLWLPHVPSKVRKVEGASSNAEGWAHYCEQMMLDEGYGGGDARLRLAQLQDALLRAARYVVGIRMHARGMTVEQAIEFFQKEGFQSKKVAEMETRRGTEDPTYLYYTLGKLEILRLRDDYRRKQGAAWSLRKFHDAFLAEGAAPLPLVRQALVGE
jgi:uncharacterized protein (DUF885 family)